MAQLLLASPPSNPVPASLWEALALVDQRLEAWSSNSSTYDALLAEVFGKAGTDPGPWQQAAAELRTTIQTSGLGIGLEVLGGDQIAGLEGAYAAHAPGGGERIYLNATWVKGASAAQIEAVLLEELGHAIDHRLNGSADTPGDEGEIFSAVLRGLAPDAAAATVNDQAWITLQGQPVLVEAAADTTAPRVLPFFRNPAFASSSIGFGLPNVGFPAGLAFADIDGDGDLDAFMGQFLGVTAFLRNTGSATAPAFGFPIDLGLPDVGSAARPSLVDIDGDGDLDAFIGNGVGNTIFLRNTGSVSATAPAFAGASIGFGLADVGDYASPAFADIDGDGDLDAFIGNKDGNILFFRNTGNTTAAAFASPSIGFGLTNVGGLANPAFVDIDGDGDLDAFIGTNTGSTLFFRNTGSATAAAFTGYSIGFGLPDVGSLASPAFADIDGDGDLDAFIGDRFGTIFFFSNTGSSGGLMKALNPNGRYIQGSIITIEVPFSEVVFVTGTPTLLLETGSIDRAATYLSGSGTNTLSFQYTVQSGDSSADLDITSSGALALNGGTIKDAAGNNALLTLPAPGAAGSLGANAALVINGVGPTVDLSGFRNPAFAGSSIGFGLSNVGNRSKPTFADIDGDGDLDAFIGERYGTTLFIRNSGSATAAAFAVGSIPFNLADVRSTTIGFDISNKSASPAFADIDGDGDLDAFIGESFGTTLFFRNTGSPTSPAFADPTISPFGNFGLPAVRFFPSPAFADIDGDGDLDAFIGNAYGNTFFFWNLGSATDPGFPSVPIGIGLPNVGVYASPAFADIDGDGDLDAFIGNRDGSTLFSRNTGSATSPAFAGSSIGFGLPDVGDYASPELADIDGDGDLDAFIGNAQGNIFFFRNVGSGGLTATNPNGRYGQGSTITIEVPFSAAVFVNTAGGTPTLLLETGSTDRSASYVSGSGTRVLTFAYTVQAGDSSADLEITSSSALSLNGGTIKDAVGNTAVLTLPEPGTTGSLGANAALVIDGVAPKLELSGFRNPAFAASSIGFGLPDVGAYASLSLADIDGDGDLDAFIGNSDGTTLFFRNTGSATSPAFAGSSVAFGLPDVGFAASPAFADSDADGDLDAFIGNFAGSTLFFRNTGSAIAAAFAGSSNGFGLPDVGTAASPSLADIDGDGDLDAFIGNANGNTLFFRNTAAAGSTTPAFAAAATNPFGLSTVTAWANLSFADIDGDGDLDAFNGNYDGSTLFFRNTGSATAAAFAGSSIGFGLAAVGSYASPAFADIDGDGDLDAFIGNFQGNTLFFRNTGSGGLSATNPNGRYGLGSTLTIEVPFSEVVFVTGTPTLLLETGGTDRTATYVSGSGTRVLTFAYTVQAGDSSVDLDVQSSAALTLNGGTIRDAAGNNAVLSLPAPGSPASLAARKNLVIDGVVPVALTTTPAYAAAAANPFGLAAVGFLASPSFVDIDGDGDLDAFIGNRYGNTLFFRNTAAAGGTTAAYAAAATNPFGLTAVGDSASPSFVDIDGDGDLDAFIGNRDGNTLFFRNTAAAGSSTPAYAAAATNPFGLAAVGFYASPSFVDIDSDGDLDAFIGNSDGNTLFFRNTAAAGSTTPAYAAAVTNPFSLTSVGFVASPSFADIDGDGDLDAFIGNREGNTFFFRNTAATGSTTPAYAAAATNPFSLVDVGYVASPSFVDIDGDGDLDAFFGTIEGNSLFFRNTAPSLGVSSSTANGRYGAGAVITLTVTFSEAVRVTGTPRLQLETGSIDRFAVYTGGSGTSTLTFSYTVQPGDSTADLEVLSSSALSLNGGRIRDAAGNNALLSLPAPGSPASLAARKNLVIDGVLPVAITTTPAYAAAAANPFGLADVGSLASPSFVDIDGDGDRDAFIGNGDGNTLFFRNTAATGSSTPAYAAAATNPFGLADVGSAASPSFVDIDGDGDLDAFIGERYGNTLFFRNTAAADSTTPAYAAAATNPFSLADVGFFASPSFADIDGDGDLDAFIGEFLGNTLFFRNTAAAGSTTPAYAAATTNPFSLADVNISVSPSFVDIDGDGDLDAFIGNGVGNTLFFRNTATAGSTKPAYAAAATNPFGLADVGSFASPSFADIDGDGDLDAFIGERFGNTLFFRNTAPSLGVSSRTANGSYGAGAAITLTVTFSEAVFVTGTPRLQLEAGSTDRTATYLSGSGTRVLTFAYTVQAGDGSADLDVLSSSALSLNGGTIRDAAGNDAVLTLAAPGSLTSLAARKNLVIDTIAPRITAGPTAIGTSGISVTSNEAGTSALYKADNSQLFARTLSANVAAILNLLPQLTVTSAILKVADRAGNRTSAAPSFWLGTSGADTITGSAAVDVLIGFGGNDTLIGGAGNDSYLFDADSSLGSDSLNEAGGGIDTLDFAATSTRAIALNLGLATTQVVNANLSLTLGSGATFENVIGGALADTLTGNGLANSLSGGGGNDTLIGGAGSDSYLFDADLALGSDTLNEAGGGSDTLNFSATSARAIALDLGLATTQVVNANLSLTLGSGATFENAIGGSLADTIIGNSLNNSLSGGGGNDTLTGGAGSDSYLFDADGVLGSDTLDEAGGGSDTLNFSATTTRSIAINLGLAASQVVSANFSLTLGSATTFENAIGGSLADTITGNNLANRLTGGGGNDTLTGGGGADRFRFATAPNAATNRDVISDFSLAQGDTIELENAIFTALSTTGPLASDAFLIGTAATDGSQRILYESATGLLRYDADGDGAAATAVAFATLTPGLALTSTSFAVT